MRGQSAGATSTCSGMIQHMSATRRLSRRCVRQFTRLPKAVGFGKVHKQVVVCNSVEERSGGEEGGQATEPVAAAAPPAVEPQSERGNKSLLAGGAFGMGVGLFIAARFSLGGPSFAALEAASVPLDEALQNGRPTVVEFYADWCEICRELLPTALEAEKEYQGRVNFVMLNVENSKWAQEMQEFNVKGIPEFVFLDDKGQPQAAAVGKIPKEVISADIKALADRTKLPFARVANSQKSSSVDAPSPLRSAAPQTLPRDHA